MNTNVSDGSDHLLLVVVQMDRFSFKIFTLINDLLFTYSEVLYEDETFRSRAFAALVASKVFYHLGAFEESLNYALGAGDLFNVTDDSEYVETIICEYSKNTLGHLNDLPASSVIIWHSCCLNTAMTLVV